MCQFKATAMYQALFEQKVLEGLKAEWKNKKAKLPAGYQGIQLPVFSLKQTPTGPAGLWQSGPCAMVIRLDFIKKYPWADVRELLYHEMAHQIVTQIYNIRNEETSHGDTFQHVCQTIGAYPGTVYSPLKDRVFGKAIEETPEDQIISKIRKLLALGTSTNQHESESACAKAMALIQKYNISRIEGDLFSKESHPNDYISIFVEDPKCRWSTDTGYVLSILQDFYFVEVVWVNSFSVDKGAWGKVPEISGRKINVEIAHYVYDYITRFIDQEWARFNATTRLHHGVRSSFGKGAMRGFRQKLENQKNKPEDSSQEKTATERRELVLATDRGLERYVRSRYPNLRTRSTKTSINGDAFKAGKMAGATLTISKGISHSAGNLGRLIA